MEKLSEIQLPNFLADDFNVVSKRTTTDTGGHTVSVEEIDIAQSQYFMGPKVRLNKKITEFSRMKIPKYPSNQSLSRLTLHYA